MTALYFAYGSNLDARQMRERCPSSRPLFRARLACHRLDFTYFSSRWNGGAADVLPDSDTEVWGVVYALSPADLDGLDRFEAGYDRILLEVRDDRDAVHRATSYVVRRKGSFHPAPVYIEKMIAAATQWEFPQAYLERLGRYRP